MHYAERELFRYTKGSVSEHNLLKKQFVHTKFLLNPKQVPKVCTNERVKACLHTKRVQPSLDLSMVSTTAHVFVHFFQKVQQKSSLN